MSRVGTFPVDSTWVISHPESCRSASTIPSLLKANLTESGCTLNPEIHSKVGRKYEVNIIYNSLETLFLSFRVTRCTNCTIYNSASNSTFWQNQSHWIVMILTGCSLSIWTSGNPSRMSDDPKNPNNHSNRTEW